MNIYEYICWQYNERRKRSHFVEELVIASLASENDDEAGDDDKSWAAKSNWSSTWLLLPIPNKLF
jgi:hypothetical protein